MLQFDRQQAPLSRAASEETDSMALGVLVGITELYDPIVKFIGCQPETGTIAKSTCRFSATDIGSEVVVIFEAARVDRPVVIGRIQTRNEDLHHKKLRIVQSEGERVEISAEQEVVLKCGKASITLTRSGKILLRGEYVLSRSSGTNRIRGATVHIN